MDHKNETNQADAVEPYHFWSHNVYVSTFARSCLCEQF